MEDHDNIKFISDLIRKEFDRTKNKTLQQECIAAAEEIALNDLADQMRYDFELEHN